MVTSVTSRQSLETAARSTDAWQKAATLSRQTHLRKLIESYQIAAQRRRKEHRTSVRARCKHTWQRQVGSKQEDTARVRRCTRCGMVSWIEGGRTHYLWW